MKECEGCSRECTHTHKVEGHELCCECATLVYVRGFLDNVFEGATIVVAIHPVPWLIEAQKQGLIHPN